MFLSLLAFLFFPPALLITVPLWIISATTKATARAIRGK